MTKCCLYSDKELLLKLRKGDKLAFDDLYKRHWEKVYAQAFKKLKDSTIAKDITQDVFIHIWANKDTNHIENLEAYLFSAVRNNVFRLLKKQSRFIPISDLFLEATLFPAADAEILKKELLKSYEALIQSMPPAQQIIYKMRFEKDLSTQEIAGQLNISRKTVQNQLTRAVSLLRASLVCVALFVLVFL
jgi:RNA polymerase sigma-70 factor (ECF subfamily)